MKRYALVIVNNEFNAPKLAQLVMPGRDTKLLAEALEDPNMGGFELTTCFNRSCAAVLEEIEGLFRRKQNDDLLLIYYAGHGLKDDFGDLFYACRNTKMHRFRSSSVSAAFIRSEMDKCKSNRIMMILDCWYSAVFDETPSSGAIGSRAGTEQAFGPGEGRVILSAGDTVRYTWDNDALLGNAEVSTFTQYLVEGLIKGTAAREEGRGISIDDLFEYARHQIVGSEKNRETPQKWSGDAAPIVIIAEPEPPTPEPPSEAQSSTEAEPQAMSVEIPPAPPPVEPRKPVKVKEPERASPIVQQLQDALLTSAYRNTLGIEFVLLKPGHFDMGAEDGDEDEKPVHPVFIQTPIYMGQYPVTQTQWESVMGNNPSRFRGGDLPIETVSWDEVLEFLKRLNDIEETKAYRLPTEAEWEYACRAGTTTPFSCGDTITTDQANFNGNHPYGDGPKGEFREKTTPVGAFAPNPWGLYDMHGNVWEWTDDYYMSYAPRPGTEDERPAGVPRVIRGGSWRNSARSCRSAKRFNITPVYRNAILGFRLAKSIEE